MKTVRHFLFLLLSLFSLTAAAQLPPGSIAPDFTYEDLEGNTWTLSNELANGRQVIICVGATWAGPCWNYVSSGALQNCDAVHGTLGTNTVTTLFIEGDPSSTVDDLYGGANSQGDYTLQMEFPIIEGDQQFVDDYAITYFPTVYKICLDGTIEEISQLTGAELIATSTSACGTVITLEYNPALINMELLGTCGEINPHIVLANYGTVTLTECDITVTTTMGYENTIHWTGSLPMNQSADIDLGAFNPTESLILTAALVGPEDFTGDNEMSVQMNGASTSTSHIQIDLLSDAFPEEIHWSITDETNTVVASGDATQANSQYVTNVFLGSEGCYKFEILDDFGDGITWSGVDGHCYVNYIQDDGDVFPIYIYLGDHNYFAEQAYFNVTEIVPVSLAGYVYLDANENGYQDTNEPGIGGVEVSLDELTTVTNEDGAYIFSDVDESISTLSIAYDQTLYPTNTTPNSYDVSSAAYSYNFGLSTNDPNFNLGYQYTDPWFFCGFDGSIWVCVANNGNQLADGTFTMTLDPLLNYLSAYPAPASVNGNTVTWDIQDMGLGEVFYYSITVASPDFNSMGEEITNSVSLVTYDNDGNIADEDAGSYATILACSYDPNDKQGTPAGVTDAHIIPNGTSIEYLVRFQNTGNYQAFNIHVLDQLDENLDFSTFEIIATSHYCQPTLNSSTKEIDFFFADINLPDSTTNEAGSHGFIRYRVALLPNLPEMTTVENTAFIYFDFNPAVITNTTLHTVSDAVSVAEESDWTAIVYPNPTSGLVSITLPQSIGSFQIIATDITGKQILSLGNFNGTRATIDTEKLPVGTYFLQIRSQSGIIINPTKLVVIR
jgi:uncharacterized repeat protein (TIGR01451 family)